MWESKKLLKVTPWICRGRDFQTCGMHWITVHAGLALTFFSCLFLAPLAGAMQKKASYKEVAPRQTPLHCSYTENHLRVGQHLWWLSSPNQGVCGDCQVRSAITLLGPGISHRDSDHPVGQTCIHTLAMSYVTDQLVPSSHLKQRRKQYWPLELLWWLKS